MGVDPLYKVPASLRGPLPLIHSAGIILALNGVVSNLTGWCPTCGGQRPPKRWQAGRVTGTMVRAVGLGKGQQQRGSVRGKGPSKLLLIVCRSWGRLSERLSVVWSREVVARVAFASLPIWENPHAGFVARAISTLAARMCPDMGRGAHHIGTHSDGRSLCPLCFSAVDSTEPFGPTSRHTHTLHEPAGRYSAPY